MKYKRDLIYIFIIVVLVILLVVSNCVKKKSSSMIGVYYSGKATIEIIDDTTCIFQGNSKCEYTIKDNTIFFSITSELKPDNYGKCEAVNEEGERVRSKDACNFTRKVEGKIVDDGILYYDVLYNKMS